MEMERAHPLGSMNVKSNANLSCLYHFSQMVSLRKDQGDTRIIRVHSVGNIFTADGNLACGLIDTLL